MSPLFCARAGGMDIQAEKKTNRDSKKKKKYEKMYFSARNICLYQKNVVILPPYSNHVLREDYILLWLTSGKCPK